jgi:hypothetical protein
MIVRFLVELLRKRRNRNEFAQFVRKGCVQGGMPAALRGTIAIGARMALAPMGAAHAGHGLDVVGGSRAWMAQHRAGQSAGIRAHDEQSCPFDLNLCYCAHIFGIAQHTHLLANLPI